MEMARHVRWKIYIMFYYETTILDDCTRSISQNRLNLQNNLCTLQSTRLNISMQWFDRTRVCSVELQCIILSPQALNSRLQARNHVLLSYEWYWCSRIAVLLYKSTFSIRPIYYFLCFNGILHDAKSYTMRWEAKRNITVLCYGFEKTATNSPTRKM